MDTGADTLSSGRFGGQWAFLSNPPTSPQHGTGSQTRSLPPTSTYIRSDRSSVSPLPHGLHFQHFNASRSSLPRNIYNPSVGGYSSATHPSQPVLIRVNSDVASNHLHPLQPPARPPRRRSFAPTMGDKLPPISEYGFEAIWNTVQADVEEDVNAIAEIWGQHRLVLADQHESHLPPQGEIRAPIVALEAVAEASASTERLGAPSEDVNVMVADLDASLVEGSNAGSAAYGLLERLQAMPQTRRQHSDFPNPASETAGPSAPRMQSTRNQSSPALLDDIPATTPVEVVAIPKLAPSPNTDAKRSSKHLLQTQPFDNPINNAAPSRSTGAVVSEVYLSAGAAGRVVSDPPVVSEAGRHYPLYSYDESEVFEGGHNGRSTQTRQLSFRERVQRLVLLGDLGIAIGWRTRTAGRRQGFDARAGDGSDAEDRLRGILGRQVRPSDAVQGQPNRPTSQGGRDASE